jgi:hypothetical protein
MALWPLNSLTLVRPPSDCMNSTWTKQTSGLIENSSVRERPGPPAGFIPPLTCTSLKLSSKPSEKVRMYASSLGLR